MKLLAPPLDDLDREGLVADSETVHFDRAFDYLVTRPDAAKSALLI